MISTIFDQALKLFGRGFFIAAFMPSLLMVIVLACQWWNPADLLPTLAKADDKDWLKSAPQLALAVVAVYLAAYLLYGVRAGVQQLYQGNWPVPLRCLSTILLASERRTFRRWQRRCKDELRPKDVADWACPPPAYAPEFGNAYSSVRIRPAETPRQLREARQFFSELRSRLWGKEELDSAEYGVYCRALTVAHRLQANRADLPTHVVTDLASFVEELRLAHKASAALRGGANRLREEALRAWREASGRVAREFPDKESWLQHTRFGNVTAVQELYPLERYGIALSDLWPRLKAVIPKETADRIDEANIYLDFTVLMSFLSLAAACSAVAAAFYSLERPLLLRILTPVGLLLLAWLFYHLAIEATRAFGVQLQVAVDIHRFKVLDALGLPRPKSPAEEQKVWTALRYFIVQADPLPEEFHFKDEPAKP
jgi:hypothetical protein